MIKQRAV
jgi:hypothetical protein